MSELHSSPAPSSLSKSSSALVSAALAGLLAASAAVACSDGGKAGVGPSQTDAGADSGGAGGAAPSGGSEAGATDTAEAGAGGAVSDTYDNVISDGVEIDAKEFQALCDERNGWVYVTAFCAGAGMCKGLSLLGTTLTDHSCKGMNSCGGAGCVVLPADTGLTGKEIYSAGPCGGCHGDWSNPDKPDFNIYNVVHGSDLSDEQALTRFKDSTDQRLLSIVIFGTQGLHPDGTPYSNMPAYYQKYSLAEIKRAVQYVKTLPTAVEQYDIFGVTPGFGIPDAPSSGGAGGGGGGTGGGGTGGGNSGSGG